ncbi:MAG: dienelactone hydrolase family protein [Hyphomonadaceae bacterium]
MGKFEARIEALAPHFTIVKPEGPGPFPVALQFHGCGGVKPVQMIYANAAREAGWAAIIVDSYAHRSIGRLEAYATVCTGLRLWGRERAGDLFAAHAWARRQSWADPDCIALAGWSHGGWTILDALSLSQNAAQIATRLDVPEDLHAGVGAAFLVYPYAGRGSIARLKGWRIAPKTAAILCGKDHVVGHVVPRRTLAKVQESGTPLDVHFFADATHTFDEEGARDLRCRYDADATARAAALYRELLASVRHG